VPVGESCSMKTLPSWIVKKEKKKKEGGGVASVLANFLQFVKGPSHIRKKKGEKKKKEKKHLSPCA